MSKMKLETLTSLHIGSGDMLQKDSDFVFGKDAEDFSTVGCRPIHAVEQVQE